MNGQGTVGDSVVHLLDEHGASGTNYYLADRQNSVNTLINYNGNASGSYTYDPYGAKVSEAPDNRTALAAAPGLPGVAVVWPGLHGGCSTGRHERT